MGYPLAVQGVLFAVVLSISLVVATASYRWVEKPFIELGRIFGRFVKAKSRKNLMPTEAGISLVKAD